MDSIYGESELVKSAADFIEKGKKANLGEVREWNGVKYQKTTQGWIQAGKAKSSKENGGKVEDKKLKTENFYGVEITPIQGMKFSKYLENKNIAMNTKTKEDRLLITKEWLKNNQD